MNGIHCAGIFLSESRRTVRDGRKSGTTSPWSIQLKCECSESRVGQDDFSPLPETLFIWTADERL
ncbi:MAG: hypothetical protein SPF60_07420, partial [Lachnospiraceae bacterium]|nr:hypothetical protein [Lachnospiraceae bacterium]